MIYDILYVVFLVNIVLIGLFGLYNLFFCIGYLVLRPLGRKKEAESKSEIYWNRFAVIVPAHNEELLLDKLIDSVENINYPKERYEIIIIADNCTDKTAEIAIKRGVKCMERQDPAKRGKPNALKWLLEQLDLNNYDAYTIVDADTMIDSNYLKGMNCKLNMGAEAIQGYFDVMNPNDTWLTRISVIPGILKFKMRYYCKDRVGLSCPLMGNGMCFSQSIIKKYGWNAFSITENWEYYIQLIINGHTVQYAEDSVIYSHAVRTLSHGVTQRKRWLKGQLIVLKEYCKPLFKKAFGGRDIVALDAFIELSMPSYAMLLNWTIIIFVAAGLSWYGGVQSNVFLLIAGGLLFVQLTYLITAVFIAKPSIRTLLSLLGIPIFLLWKMGVTMLSILSINNIEWEKTERKIQK